MTDPATPADPLASRPHPGPEPARPNAGEAAPGSTPHPTPGATSSHSVPRADGAAEGQAHEATPAEQETGRSVQESAADQPTHTLLSASASAPEEQLRFADDDRMVTVRMPVRRAPRISRFVLAGAVVGMLIGLVVGLLPSSPAEGVGGSYDPLVLVAFWVALSGVFGGLAGAAVAVVIDKRS